MPGKKGFGDTRKTSSESPVYKKQGYGTAKSPFTMKGSPVKQVSKSFNMRGGPSTTPGFSETNISKTLKTQKPWGNIRPFAKDVTKTFGKIGKFVRGTSLVGAAYELFKGYGNLSKTKHGKEIIKGARTMSGKI